MIKNTLVHIIIFTCCPPVSLEEFLLGGHKGKKLCIFFAKLLFQKAFFFYSMLESSLFWKHNFWVFENRFIKTDFRVIFIMLGLASKATECNFGHFLNDRLFRWQTRCLWWKPFSGTKLQEKRQITSLLSLIFEVWVLLAFFSQPRTG